MVFFDVFHWVFLIDPFNIDNRIDMKILYMRHGKICVGDCWIKCAYPPQYFPLIYNEIFNKMIFWFSTNNLTEKKKATKKATKKAKKNTSDSSDSGIIIVDDDLVIDRETELEERRAYLEEARSQEASSD